MNWPRGVPLPSATVREDVPFAMRWNGVAPPPTATGRSACSIPPRSSPAGTARLAEPLGVGAESHPRVAIVVEAPPDGLVEQFELILKGRPAFGRRQLQEVE
jgi:hypothetical protein